jgi:EamA domain-containing membrane protein RarD
VHGVKASTLDFGVRIVAALLMLVGAVIIFTGSEALAFSLIAVGAALFVIERFVDRRRLAH